MNESRYTYPVDEWCIRETQFRSKMIPRNETVFSVGNGYIGMRGNLEEGRGAFQNGTYLNGFYESQPIRYGERAHAFAEKSQTMLNVPDGKGITLSVNGEEFNLKEGSLLDYNRVLDLRNGILSRDVSWISPSGLRILLKTKRIASFKERHLALITYAVEVQDGSADIVLISRLDWSVRNRPGGKDPRSGSGLRGGSAFELQEERIDGTDAACLHITRGSRFILLSAMRNRLESERPYSVSAARKKRAIEISFKLTARRGQRIELVKYIAYHTSLEFPADDLMDLSGRTLSWAVQQGSAYFFAAQEEYLANFWTASDILIDGDPAVQQGLRFNLFHILQSTGQDGKTSIAAKGLTGDGYEGHYFWDTETYVLPFLTYTKPSLAKKLVEYRYRCLEKARHRAAELSLRGALYPWRTIGGEECSAYFPAGTAQYHINADIIYAMRKYVEISGDLVFLLEGGAEMLFETARMWADLGCFVLRKNKEGDHDKGAEFRINGVTGPDEYTALVNNNLYTNVMARGHLEYAASTARLLKENYPDDYRRIADRIGFQEEEIAQWERAAELMLIPYDSDLGLHPQDDSFLEKEVWNFKGTPRENYPLLLHYHPLVIYRHQVLKQPDVVLALFLQGERFSLAEKKRNFDYYDPLTTGDSSLSPCVQSVLAAELGYTESAYKYFMKTARIDLDDCNRNVKFGVHTAAMGGTWISLVYGFAGMRDYGGEIAFRPFLPPSWSRLKFSLSIRGRVLEVDIRRHAVRYSLLTGSEFSFQHERSEVFLSAGGRVEISLVPVIEAVIFDLDGVLADTSDYLTAEVTPADLLPGIERLLEDLRQAGVKIGLASASRNAPDVVGRLGIGDYFDLIVEPGVVSKGKPDPEIFYLAAAGLNVSFRNCVCIEDAQAGIAAIKSAGMFAVGIGEELKGADLSLGGTAELTWKRIKAGFSRFS